MRYTKAQAAHLKEKGLDRYNAIYKTIRFKVRTESI